MNEEVGEGERQGQRRTGKDKTALKLFAHLGVKTKRFFQKGAAKQTVFEFEISYPFF